MTIRGMNHFNVLTDDLDRTLEFYVGLLGLERGPRPALSFDGAWLYSGGEPIVHISVTPEMPAQRAGALDHIAFTAQGIDAVERKFQARGVHYDLRQQVTSRIWQLFCHDPNGAKVELDFDPSERPAGA